MTDDEQARREVQRRFGVWERHSVPARKYALLVAGYFRSRGPLVVEGEEKYLRFYGDDGRALLELVEVSADRPLTVPERADAVRHAAASDEVSRLKESRYAAPFSNPGAGYLRDALDDPHQAARRLLTDACASLPAIKFSWPDLLRVMECLRPAAWEPSAGWTPPAEAVARARRMYERRDFADLWALADMLEAAGCPDRPLLDHCRSHPEHVRGCAALDRLLHADGGPDDGRTDPFTGVWHLRALDVALAEAVRRAWAGTTPLSYLALDIDRLGGVNLTFGIPGGDRVVRAVAGLLRATAPPGALVARTGGDEFGILLSGVDGAEAVEIAERVRLAVAGWYGAEAPVTVSVGVAILGPDDPNGTILLRAAGERLMRAKAGGRNRVCG